MNLDLSKLNPLDPNDFKTIASEIEDVLLSGNMAYAEEMLGYVNSILEGHGKEIESKSPELYNQYQNYWIKLAFQAFIVLESEDQSNLLKSRAMYAVSLGMDLDELVKQCFLIYESDEYVKDLFREFVKALEQNSEQFGAQPIEVEGRKMMPTLKYWLLDYSKFPTRVAKRGSVERLNYVNQSVNARSLTQVYRQQLLKILKFYDDLVNAERPVTQVNSKQRGSFPPRVVQQPAPSMDFMPPGIKPMPLNIQQKLDDLKSRVSK